MKPSQSTIASLGIGVPLATIASWALTTWGGVEVPGPVEAAFGAVLGAVVGYFFKGGMSEGKSDA